MQSPKAARITQQLLRAQAVEDMGLQAADAAWGSETGFKLGNPKAASQSYNAGALFMNSGTSLSKG